MKNQAAELAASIRARLEAVAEPEMAAGARNFFREPVDPIGVRSRDLQQVVAEVYRAVKKWPAAERNLLCTLLWEGGKMEEGVLVCHLYRRFAKQCAGPEFRMFERWIDRYDDTLVALKMLLVMRCPPLVRIDIGRCLPKKLQKPWGQDTAGLALDVELPVQSTWFGETGLGEQRGDAVSVGHARPQSDDG
jgi:hypothetical protein